MPLLTAKELAAELHLKPKQIRRLALSGKIPALRFNREWRFDLDAVRTAATYTDPISADAVQAARRGWQRPRRAR